MNAPTEYWHCVCGCISSRLASRHGDYERWVCVDCGADTTARVHAIMATEYPSTTRPPSSRAGAPELELARLALYDAVVGSSLAWRATSTPPPEFKTDAEREAFYVLLDKSRQAVQHAGKHVVDEQVVRELAGIYARRPKHPEADAVDPAERSAADSWSTPAAALTPAAPPTDATPRATSCPRLGACFSDDCTCHPGGVDEGEPPRDEIEERVERTQLADMIEIYGIKTGNKNYLRAADLLRASRPAVQARGAEETTPPGWPPGLTREQYAEGIAQARRMVTNSAGYYFGGELIPFAEELKRLAILALCMPVAAPSPGEPAPPDAEYTAMLLRLRYAANYADVKLRATLEEARDMLITLHDRLSPGEPDTAPDVGFCETTGSLHRYAHLEILTCKGWVEHIAAPCNSCTGGMDLSFPCSDMIEQVSDAVHDNWMASKRAAGVTSRKLESGEELMVPYAALSERAKELDRGTVRTVLDVLPTLGYSVAAAPLGARAGEPREATATDVE